MYTSTHSFSWLPRERNVQEVYEVLARTHGHFLFVSSAFGGWLFLYKLSFAVRFVPWFLGMLHFMISDHLKKDWMHKSIKSSKLCVSPSGFQDQVWPSCDELHVHSPGFSNQWILHHRLPKTLCRFLSGYPVVCTIIHFTLLQNLHCRLMKQSENTHTQQTIASKR